jgi:hypothetical protein
MRQYLAEGITGAFPFIVDRSKTPVSESRPNGASFQRIPGRFSVCDCVNGNNRRYRRTVWEKNLQPGSPLLEAIKRNGAFGLLEHPKDGVITLNSPISHQVIKAEMVETKDAGGNTIYEVIGEIALYDTLEGQRLKSFIDGGYNPLVSSRGYGSLAKASDGVDEVQEDYVCEGWDVVIKPSFENAELTPNRQALSTTSASVAPTPKPNPTAESKTRFESAEIQQLAEDGKTWLNRVEQSLNKNLKESTPSTGPSAAAAPAPTKTNTMEINEIKSRITALGSVDPSRLNTQRFAESMGQVEELHQQVAEWSATDPKRSWEAQKMHRQLDQVANAFSETAQAPVKQSKRLAENNGKLMKVINAVASTALTYKKKLGEALKKATAQTKMIEELVRRGQGWQRLAESRKGKFLTLEKDFDTSCEALDLMSQRYHEDVTELGRRVIVLEFKEKAQTPEIQKSLKEATRLRHIATIREQLEGPKDNKLSEEGSGVEGKQPKEGEQPSHEAIKDEKQKGAGSPDQGKIADEPGKVKNESAPDKSKQTPPLTEARVLTSERNIRDVSESVDLVKRLSGSIK